MKTNILLLFLLFSLSTFAQKTIVDGVVTDQLTGEPMPFVTVRFQNSKIGAFTDTLGHYSFDTYYATDSLEFSFSGYLRVRKFVELDKSQTINVVLPILSTDYQEVTVKAPDEFPSTVLHKKVIANKKINNKEKLDSYEYEVYNKVQLDLNNIGEKFQEREVVKRLDLIMDYLDEEENGTSYLPVILSESVSNYYYKKTPRKKKEFVKASRISGIENLELNQFLGDMYLNVNIYDNNLILFNKSFISPVSNFARNFYRFYLEDSMFIDNYWCYQLKFTPKRTGDMTFEGEMWIHDTTYAVKQFTMNISPWTNINYVQGLYIEHKFEQVEDEVWMLTSEKMIADLKITKKTKAYGLYGRRSSSRTNYKINHERPLSFYSSKSTVEISDSANLRSDEYWAAIRHEPLSKQEAGINGMVDSLNNLRFFKVLKNTLYLATTGYYPLGKIELGSAFSLVSFNQVENLRLGLALRTSNKFSKRIELGGRVAYGFGDEQFKYGASMRFNITPKKRGMLIAYYNYDLEQIGQAQSAAAVSSTFGAILRTGPLDKLTFVQKAGVNLEKDIRKDIILFGGFEWKEYTAVGLANYLRPNPNTLIDDTITTLQTTELTARFRWAKDEEFISGSFDRTSIRSKYPIFAIQGIFGVKDLFGADYNYQKIDVFIEHQVNIGILGRIKYGINAGKIFGNAAYPFLKVHEGNQSFWLSNNAFNKMDFFEFVSDQYISGIVENHWDGLFFDRIPLIKKAKLRLVTTAKFVYGQRSARHSELMRIPNFTKDFGNTPYVEVAAGIENIFKLGRVDVFWRLTHLDPGVRVTDLAAFGVRAKYYINF
ncbi:MAG: carboxypeptidase-like regulatory domain-containing protein [Fluviicola sp.]|nr:carboxypeptidase-like regulatory domain-containing protein [Fluviicola sp.]